MRKVYNLKYATRLLDIDRGTLYRYNKEGKINLRKIDNIFFITHSDLTVLRNREVSKGRDLPEVGSKLLFV